MFKKDFIIRQFEDFGRVLARIIGLKIDKDWHAFQNEIADAVKTFTGFELSVLESLDTENFENTVLKQGNLSSDQVKILARLMFERLEEFLQRNEQERVHLQVEKCKLLYHKALENLTQNEFDLDIHYKLEFLKAL